MLVWTQLIIAGQPLATQSLQKASRAHPSRLERRNEASRLIASFSISSAVTAISARFWNSADFWRAGHLRLSFSEPKGPCLVCWVKRAPGELFLTQYRDEFGPSPVWT